MSRSSCHVHLHRCQRLASSPNRANLACGLRLLLTLRLARTKRDAFEEIIWREMDVMNPLDRWTKDSRWWQLLPKRLVHERIFLERCDAALARALNPYSGGLSPGEVIQRSICTAISLARACRSSISRFLPGGRRWAASRAAWACCSSRAANDVSCFTLRSRMAMACAPLHHQPSAFRHATMSISERSHAAALRGSVGGLTRATNPAENLHQCLAP